MGHKNKETDKKNLKLTDLSSVGEFGFIEHIKKNVKIIEKLISKIEEIPSSSKKIMTTLIIDDECDQASPNTKEFKNQASEISRTNKLLRKVFENKENFSIVEIKERSLPHTVINRSLLRSIA